MITNINIIDQQQQSSDDLTKDGGILVSNHHHHHHQMQPEQQQEQHIQQVLLQQQQYVMDNQDGHINDIMSSPDNNNIHQQQQYHQTNNHSIVDENDLNLSLQVQQLLLMVQTLQSRIQHIESSYGQNSITFPHANEGQSLDSFSEEVAKVIADTSPFLLWMSGVDGKAIYFNKKWYEFSGRTLVEDGGDGWTELVHRDDLVRIFSIYMESFHRRAPFKLEYRALRHDGVWRWILDTGCPRFSPDKKFLGYVGSCLDVTDMWHSKHEIMTVKKQQGSLLKCSEFLSNTASSSFDSSTDSDTFKYHQSVERLRFFKIVLKSLTYSFLSNGSIIFQVDQNNPLILRVAQKHNLNIDPDYVIQLPEGFWDKCKEAFINQDSELSDQEDDDNLSSPPFDPVQLERRNFYDEIPSSPLEQYPISEMLRRMDEENNRIQLQPTIYSLLYQNYISPLLSRLGMKSVTTEFIPLLDTNKDKDSYSIPYGFISIGTVAQRSFTAIEQDTLKTMSNILSGFICRQSLQVINQTRSILLSTLRKHPGMGTIITDHNGLILDVNEIAHGFSCCGSDGHNNQIVAGNNILNIFGNLAKLKETSYIKQFSQFIRHIRSTNLRDGLNETIGNVSLNLQINDLPDDSFLFLISRTTTYHCPPPPPTHLVVVEQEMTTTNQFKMDGSSATQTITTITTNIPKIIIIVNDHNQHLKDQIQNYLSPLKGSILFHFNNHLNEIVEQDLKECSLLLVEDTQSSFMIQNQEKFNHLPSRLIVLMVSLVFLDHRHYFNSADSFMIKDPFIPTNLDHLIQKVITKNTVATLTP